MPSTSFAWVANPASGIGLSNGNLTASIAGSGSQCVMAAPAIEIASDLKLWVEVTGVYIFGDDEQFGLVPSFTTVALPFSASNFLRISAREGQIYIDGVAVGSSPRWSGATYPTTVGLAVDFGARLLWVTADGVTFSPSGSPFTGAGGLDISAWLSVSGGAVALAGQISNDFGDNSQLTLNCGPTWVFTPPPGYNNTGALAAFATPAAAGPSAAPGSQQQMLGELLEVTPQGWAFPTSPSSNWGLFLSPIADEWALIESSAAAMIGEINPLTCTYSLADYQRVLGPDPYGRDAASLDLSTGQLAELAAARWTAGGNMAPLDYIGLAAAMGVTITIQQYHPSIAGLAMIGDLLTSDLPVSAGSAACGACLGWAGIAFYWLVNLPTNVLSPAYAGIARAGDFLGSGYADLLATVILGEAPSHTIPTFRYS